MAGKRVIPELDNWMSLPKAAKILKMSRQAAWDAVQNHVFTDVRQVAGVGERPALILVRPKEVTVLLAQKQAAAEAADRGREEAEEPVPVG